MDWLTRSGSGRLLAALLITLGAGAARFTAAALFPPDWDEDDYLAAAATYRSLIEAGDVAALPDVAINFEHPPLTKLVYALGIDPRELADFHLEIPRFSRWQQPPHSTAHARAQSAAFGTLTVLAVALVAPLSGAMLSAQSIHLHYTSVAYLEALPTLLSALAVIAYHTHKRGAFWLSAGLLGAAVAGKYMYGLAGVAILLHWLLFARTYRLPSRLARLMGWGLLALTVFLALNPYLWRNPVERLRGQLGYFSEYASWYTDRHTFTRPFEEMIAPDIHLKDLMQPHQIAPLKVSDVALGALALPGAVVLLWRRSVWGIWLALGFAFMSVWTAQWAQHRMVIVVPYSFAAAAGAGALTGGAEWVWRRIAASSGVEPL